MRRSRADALTLTVEEAAIRLGISRTLAYELAAKDALPVPTFRLGTRLVVARVALERALAGEPAPGRGAEGVRDGIA